MVVCDVCEKNIANDKFYVPAEYGCYIKLDGGRVIPLLGRITKIEVVLCTECQRKIAKFISEMRDAESK